MPKRRGNPNWLNPAGITPPLGGATSFEEVAESLGLSPEHFAGSLPLKEWVRRNKNHKYVPPDLVETWGFEVNSDA